MTTIYMNAAMRLAELLGYTEITPEGQPCWRIYEGLLARDSDGDMSRIPDWVHDNGDAFALMVEHSLYPTSHKLSDSILVGERLEYVADHQNKETAVRYAIVMAVIAKLEAKEKS